MEEWKLRLTSAKVEVEVEAELGNIAKYDTRYLFLAGGNILQKPRKPFPNASNKLFPKSDP